MAYVLSGPSFRWWWCAICHVLVFVGIGHTLAFAQGFNLISGRNHPELQWRVADTQHFRIVYPRHLDQTAEQVAPIAEVTYDALAANLGIRPSGPIRIYLTDEDEITNGFAVRIGDGHTNVWVHQNDANRWTGPEKWLRHVIAHELAHIFHFQAVQSNLGLLQFLLAEPLPRFWTEGLAQYQSETWNAQRGDRWLRTAVLDDRLSYTDGRSIWNGNLMYAVGNSQVRYFADQYGDSTLAKLLAHRKRTLLGLGRVHDFRTAFKATVDKSYDAFYDDWRRHVNVYYNTLAGQMQPYDSLAVPPLRTPGQYVFDVQYSPDTTLAAILSIMSVRRPVRRLYVVDRDTQRSTRVAEGAINPPIAWSPDGRNIAFSRLSRGSHGSLINDLFLVRPDGRGLRRLTRSRRAVSPSFSPDGRLIAFAGTEDGTTNIFLLDVESGDERRLTDFSGDVQLNDVRWAPEGSRIAFSRFDDVGRRDVAVADVASGAVFSVTDGLADDRGPVWSSSGDQLAYTSLRDDVPNTFIFDFSDSTHERVTHLATGARVVDWLPADSTFESGRLILISNASKTRDHAFRISAGIRVPGDSPQVPAPYASWVTHRPPRTVPTDIPADSTLLRNRRNYNSFRNLTHVGVIALPYYENARDWGVIGATTWMEPLGKHIIAAVGGLSVASPVEHSFFVATYVNNQWHPSVALSLYSFPGWTRIYGDGLLVEHFAGGEVSAVWPLDWKPRPYAATGLGIRLRYVDFDPVATVDLGLGRNGLAPPERGRQADLQVSLARKMQRPWRDNVVHPLDGRGIRLRATGAAKIPGTNREFVRADASMYSILGENFLPALHRVFIYGRALVQSGQSAPQDYVGLSRYDDVRLDVPGLDRLLMGEAERVRGYRSYALGDRMLFGSIEYRIPVLPSLHTRLLGVVSLGATTLSLLGDGAVVWSGANLDAAIRRAGAGLELKNALRLGFFEIMHAVGLAAPLADLGRRDATEVYYRISTAVPF